MTAAAGPARVGSSGGRHRPDSHNHRPGVFQPIRRPVGGAVEVWREPGRRDLIAPLCQAAAKKLAQRFGALDAEIKNLDRQLTRLVTVTAPKVVALRGVGIHTTATLPVTASDNPERLRSKGTFARLTGTAPIAASSGQTDRFRLPRGADRQANAALHLIAVNRLLCDPRSKAYVRKRTGGTKANLDILRRLKRYTARELYPLIVEALSEVEPDLRTAA